MRIEQGLEPLRSRIGDLRLKEQAAALNAEQLATQLLEAGADEAALTPELGTARASSLQGEITRLQNGLSELGAVNLAALQELETARERKGYLDAQAADLTGAMETLENAIRRIDRETRELLRSTFDTVNGHFGLLFPELFGGGRAELVMTCLLYTSCWASRRRLNCAANRCRTLFLTAPPAANRCRALLSN